MTVIIKTPESKDWIVRDSSKGQDYEIHVDSLEKARQLADRLMLDKINEKFKTTL